MSKGVEERLAEQLDKKDDEIEELRAKVRELEERLECSAAGWSLPRELENVHPRLPVPRLEMEWRPGSNGWTRRTIEYRLVYRHLTGKLMAIPLGHTTTSGGTGESPFTFPSVEPMPEWARGLSPDAIGAVWAMPYRDGAHAPHDAAHLGLPFYAITPSCPVRVDDLETHAYQRKLGLEHRSELQATTSQEGPSDGE